VHLGQLASDPRFPRRPNARQDNCSGLQIATPRLLQDGLQYLLGLPGGELIEDNARLVSRALWPATRIA